MKKTILKEIDLRNFIKEELPSFEETTLFINNPTREDVEKASKDVKIIYSNKPSNETAEMIYNLPMILKFFVSVFDVDLNDLSFKEYVIKSLENSTMEWNPLAGFTKGEIKDNKKNDKI